MSQARKLKAQGQSWQVDIGAGVKVPVDNTCVGVAESLEPEPLLRHALEFGFKHICQKNGHMYDSERATAENLVVAPESYLEFPAATILSPAKVNTAVERKLILLDKTFDASAQKHPLLDLVLNLLQSKNLPQTVIDDAIVVCDEFFTNAVYNAPFVDPTTHKNPGVSRRDVDVNFTNGKVGRLFLAQGEKGLVIGCRDPYGSLDLKKYLGKIRETYQKGPAAALNFGAGGAGIGSYIIFNVGASLYFGVWPGKATLLCCTIPLGLSNRLRSQMPKHLHWIQR